MLPIVDLSRPRLDILQKLRIATTKFGAFYVKSDFSAQQYSELFAAADALDCVPANIKSKLKFQNGGFTRGFLTSGSESGSKAQESKQGFAFGFDLQENGQNPMEGQNVWPPFKGNERQVLNSFFTECSFISKVLNSHISEIYTGKASTWDNLFIDGERISLARLFSYPAVKDIPLGSSPHTDWGYLTLIKSREVVAGLEMNVNGSWVKIPALPPGETDPSNYWIANAGDYMTLLTNGQTISPLHRVLLSSHPRAAFVYFSYPNYNVTIPSYRESKLSVFENQGLSSMQSNATCFGELLYQKWLQVYRTTY